MVAYFIGNGLVSKCDNGTEEGLVSLKYCQKSVHTLDTLDIDPVTRLVAQVTADNNNNKMV
jgi:hypothetical protein